MAIIDVDFINNNLKPPLVFPLEEILSTLQPIEEKLMEDFPELKEDLEEVDVHGEIRLMVRRTLETVHKHLSREEIIFLNSMYEHKCLLSILKKYPKILEDLYDTEMDYAEKKW